MLSPQEEELLDVALASLPRAFRPRTTDALLNGSARILGGARAQVTDWRNHAYIGTAAAEYLDQHARDMGTWRQDGEDDAALALRLRTPVDAITAPALLAGLNAIVPPYAPVAMVEMPRDGAFVSTRGALDPGRRGYLSRGYRVGHGPMPRQLRIIHHVDPSDEFIVARMVAYLNEYKAAGVHVVLEQGDF
jgi:hypothetical protein